MAASCSSSSTMELSVTDSVHNSDERFREVSYSNFKDTALDLTRHRGLVLPLTGLLTEVTVNKRTNCEEENQRGENQNEEPNGSEQLNMDCTGSDDQSSMYRIIKGKYWRAVSLTTKELQSDDALQLLQQLNLYGEYEHDEQFSKFLINFAKTVRTYDEDELECYVTIVLFDKNVDLSLITSIVLTYRPTVPKIIIQTARPINLFGDYTCSFEVSVNNVDDLDYTQFGRFFNDHLSTGLVKDNLQLCPYYIKYHKECKTLKKERIPSVKYNHNVHFTCKIIYSMES